MKTKVYSVRLESLTEISEKCLLAKAFDGSKCLIPKSQYFGKDYEVTKSDAYWISAWILGQNEIQYSTKKEGWYNPKTGKVEAPFFMEIEHHIPKKKNPAESNIIPELKK